MHIWAGIIGDLLIKPYDLSTLLSGVPLFIFFNDKITIAGLFIIGIAQTALLMNKLQVILASTYNSRCFLSTQIDG